MPDSDFVRKQQKAERELAEMRRRIDNHLDVRKQQKAERELAEMRRRIENHLDVNGKSILFEYPYFVDLLDRPMVLPETGTPAAASPAWRPSIPEILSRARFWLEENMEPGTWAQHWVTRFYFKNKETATLFKMSFSGWH